MQLYWLIRFPIKVRRLRCPPTSGAEWRSDGRAKSVDNQIEWNAINTIHSSWLFSLLSQLKSSTEAKIQFCRANFQFCSFFFFSVLLAQPVILAFIFGAVEYNMRQLQTNILTWKTFSRSDIGWKWNVLFAFFSISFCACISDRQFRGVCVSVLFAIFCMFYALQTLNLTWCYFRFSIRIFFSFKFAIRFHSIFRFYSSF